MNKLLKVFTLSGLFATTVSLRAEVWDKTFPKSEAIEHKKITFKNRYGITLAADLYLPKNRTSEKLAAIAISGPFGAVKEQSSGLYAQEMAERGFVAIAFDPSYTGESGGEPRHIASPDIYSEDFSAAVDFLGQQSTVDRNKIGVIGICGHGGFALNIAAADKRIKAVATTSMYDIPRVSSKGYYDKLSPQERAKVLLEMSEQRWSSLDALGAKVIVDKLTGKEPLFVKQYYNYYKTKRGFHPRSINSNGAWAISNGLSLMNMPILNYIKEISPRPILIIAGEEAHSRYFSEDAFKAASEPKELVILPKTNHVDLYDQKSKIPFNKMTAFFKESLR